MIKQFSNGNILTNRGTVRAMYEASILAARLKYQMRLVMTSVGVPEARLQKVVNLWGQLVVELDKFINSRPSQEQASIASHYEKIFESVEFRHVSGEYELEIHNPAAQCLEVLQENASDSEKLERIKQILESAKLRGIV